VIIAGFSLCIDNPIHIREHVVDVFKITSSDLRTADQGTMQAINIGISQIVDGDYLAIC
jgi:hypothetical protein